MWRNRHKVGRMRGFRGAAGAGPRAFGFAFVIVVQCESPGVWLSAGVQPCTPCWALDFALSHGRGITPIESIGRKVISMLITGKKKSSNYQ